MEQVIRYNKLNMNNVTFTEMKANRYGGKTVGVKYNGKTMVVQTPKMYLPYGLSEFHVKDSNGNNTGDVKYSLDLSFKGWNDEGSSPTKTFYENMKKLDELLVAKGVENRVAWFKSKSHTKEVVKALYSSAVRMSKDRETGEVTDKWPPTMKAKVYNYDGTFKCDAYNAKREPVDFSENVTKGCYVQALVSCNSVWFAGGKFGVTWSMRQLIVHPPMRITGYSFLEDEDDVDANADTATGDATDNEGKACQFYETELVSDEEEEVADDEEVVEYVVEHDEEEIASAAAVEEPTETKKKTRKKTVRKPRAKKTTKSSGSTSVGAGA